MNEDNSRIVNVMETLGKALKDNTTFSTIPIFWDMVELNPDNLPDTCIVFKALTWHVAQDDPCAFERQLDICIIHNTLDTRQITIRLTKYAEDLKEIIDNVILFGDGSFDLKFLGGSEIGALKNNKEDSESYKGSKTLFSSMIVLSYEVRY